MAQKKVPETWVSGTLMDQLNSVVTTGTFRSAMWASGAPWSTGAESTAASISLLLDNQFFLF